MEAIIIVLSDNEFFKMDERFKLIPQYFQLALTQKVLL